MFGGGLAVARGFGKTCALSRWEGGLRRSWVVRCCGLSTGVVGAWGFLSLRKMRRWLEASLKREEKPWVRLAGGLKHLHKETVRINRILKSEFEKIEPEDWE